MKLGYLQGLSFTFFLIFGLASLLDLVFSQIGLRQALNFEIVEDQNLRRSHETLSRATRDFPGLFNGH